MTCQPLWACIVDAIAWDDKQQLYDLGLENSVALALRAAADVPDCRICEDVYLHALQTLGIETSRTGESSSKYGPNALTTFAIGRSLLLGLKPVQPDLETPIFAEVCIALNEANYSMASDGLLAITLSKPISEYAPLHRRFIEQAVKYLAVVAQCYPNKHTERILNVCKKSMNTHA